MIREKESLPGSAKGKPISKSLRKILNLQQHHYPTIMNLPGSAKGKPIRKSLRKILNLQQNHYPAIMHLPGSFCLRETIDLVEVKVCEITYPLGNIKFLSALTY